MTTKKLTLKQVRWAEFLSKFSFIVTYQSEKKNDKADAFTKKPNERSANEKDNWQEHKMQVLLPPKQFKLQPIEVTNQHKKITDNLERVTHDLKKVIDKLLILPDQVKKLNQINALFTEVYQYLTNPEDYNRSNVYLRSSRVSNGLLYKNNKLWVDNDLRLDVIREVHNQPAVRHAETRKTILLIQQYYFWPKIKKDINQYIQNCHICRRAKALRDCYNGTLKPLPVPERPWTNIIIDFITGLLEYKLKNAIFMVVDRLTKEQVYILSSDKNKGTNAEATAKMLLHNI